MRYVTQYITRRFSVGMILTLSGMLIGCNGLTDSQPLPSGTADPSTYATPAGARGMRNAAIFQFEAALPQFIVDAGMITDEFQKPSVGINAFSQSEQNGGIDQRILPEGTGVSTSYGNSYNDSYNNLHSVRKYIFQAVGALAAYDTVASDTANARVMRGELYAIEGYTEIMLADLFCSGVPLSTLDFERNYTYHAGSKTTDIYRSAIAKFDTAIVLGNGVDSVVNLARIGRGRAWLNIGQYDSAMAAVQAVPNDYRYAVIEQGSAWFTQGSAATPLATFIVSDHEGTNGLPYVSSADPRSAVAFLTSVSDGPRRIPAKYQAAVSGGATPIVIADGIEAQLIRAEAALQGGDIATWLTTLNTLRTSGQVDSVTWIDTAGVSPAIYGDSGRLVSQQVDTVYNAAHTSITHIYTINTYNRPVWRAGTGGVNGLYPISDPGVASARIDTLFTERAEWLFATGHRQGDLRRLLRQYGNLPEFSDQSLVYPTGAYSVSGAGVYGSDVNLPIPAQEYMNPLFHGCLNRGA